jgi:uncharacterized membrane protein YeaQ/YmgE (transglycosylase-associated protein family)
LSGRQNVSLVMTVVLGAVGALGGSAIVHALSGRGNTPGIDWIALGVDVVVAAIAILVYGVMTGRERTASSSHQSSRRRRRAVSGRRNCVTAGTAGKPG